jgi:hypothetical protein
MMAILGDMCSYFFSFNAGYVAMAAAALKIALIVGVGFEFGVIISRD